MNPKVPGAVKGAFDSVKSAAARAPIGQIANSAAVGSALGAAKNMGAGAKEKFGALSKMAQATLNEATGPSPAAGAAAPGAATDALGILMRGSQNRKTIAVQFAVNAILGVLLLASLFFNFILFTSKPEPRYFAVGNDLRVLEMPATTDPMWTDGQIQAWAGRAVVDAYSFDFANYRDQLTRVGKVHFTQEGFSEFLSELKNSKFLETVKQERYVVTTALQGAPQIVRKAPWKGAFAWQIQVPVVVSLLNDKFQVDKRYVVELIVVRDNALADAQAVGIQQWIQKNQ